jgi:hypothetical protein
VLPNSEHIEGERSTVDARLQPLSAANVIEDAEAVQDAQHRMDGKGDFGDSPFVLHAEEDGLGEVPLSRES